MYISLLALALQLNEQRKTKQQIEDLNKSLTKSIEDKNAIEKEINDLEKYLTQYVEGFFQVDFINKLYNQIDPHPDYKKVKFSCDFKYSHPRLNVSMFNTKGDDEIVPNLYLSTAQVNILSFCIFMAKAMFAKTDKGESLDCIFIDDPIQALDDINKWTCILSVPTGCNTAYQQADQWKEFFFIDNDVTGISAISNDKDLTIKSRYTLDGKLLSHPQKGINIIKMSDGTTKKVFVK